MVTFQEKVAAKKIKQKSDTFGGMKKGFLFGDSSKPRKSAPLQNQTKLVDDIPLIKPKEPKGSDLKLPEVQAAMDAGKNMLQNKGSLSTVKHEIVTCMLFSLYLRFGKIRGNFMHAKISCSRSAHYRPEILPLQRL